MPLQVVPYQLSLFAHIPGLFVRFKVDGRTGDQWLRSVLGYLAWRAGDDWRPASDRFSPERREYLQAARLVLAVRNAPVDSKESASQAGPLPLVFASADAKDISSVACAAARNERSRIQLVALLMQANTALIDRKLLLHFTKAKLTRMLDDALARMERTA